MHQLVTVDFHGDTLFAVEEPDGVFVAVKPICDRLGMSWSAQRERINRDELLREGSRMIRLPSLGGAQDSLCLALRLINGWLFGIDVERVKPELRKAVLAYKRECYETLADRFLGPRAAERPIHAPAPEAIEERNLRAEEHKLNLVARMQAMKGPAYAFALYRGLGLPVIAPEPGEEATETVADRAFAADPIAVALEALAHAEGSWTGTPSQLYHRLCHLAPEGAVRGRRWPRDPQALGTALRRVTAMLARRGIALERRHSGTRSITVSLADA